MFTKELQDKLIACTPQAKGLPFAQDRGDSTDLREKETAPNTSAPNTQAPNSTETRPKMLLAGMQKGTKDQRNSEYGESESSESKMSEREMLIEFKERWDEEFFLDNTYQINYSVSSQNS